MLLFRCATGEGWDQLMESDEMRAIMDDPKLLRETISNNPLLKAMPGVGDQVEELLNSEAFQDPAALKAVMKQGMDAFKEAGSEFGKEFGKQMEMMMSDPEGAKLMSEMQSNPRVMNAAMDIAMNGEAAAAKYANDPEVLQLLQKLEKFQEP